MVTGRLAGGIGGAWAVGGGFKKTTFCAIGAEDLIGADVMQAEVLLALTVEGVVVLPYRLQQVVSAADIALNEHALARPRGQNGRHSQSSFPSDCLRLASAQSHRGREGR